MKRNLVLLVLLIIASVPAYAELSVTESTGAEYLINNGFSEAVAEDILIEKNRAAGKTIEPLYDKKQNKLVKGWFSFWSYVDPAREESDKLHHDVKLTPSYTDL